MVPNLTAEVLMDVTADVASKTELKAWVKI